MASQKQKKWTEKEEQYLVENYGKKSLKEMGSELKRTPKSVGEKIRRMKEKGIIQENAKAKSSYENMTVEELLAEKERLLKLKSQQTKERINKELDKVKVESKDIQIELEKKAAKFEDPENRKEFVNEAKSTVKNEYDAMKTKAKAVSDCAKEKAKEVDLKELKSKAKETAVLVTAGTVATVAVAAKVVKKLLK